MAVSDTCRNSACFIFILAFGASMYVIVSCQPMLTCENRKCETQLSEEKAEYVKYPDSFQSVINQVGISRTDEIRWTLTTSSDHQILLRIQSIAWPQTELKFEELNPSNKHLRNEGEVFPIFPEYNAKVVKTGIFLSRTHQLRMEMDIPKAADLPTEPRFQMAFTAVSVTELYRCTLSSTVCDVERTAPWSFTSDGYEFFAESPREGSITVRTPPGIELQGSGILSFGYSFKYSGSSWSSRGSKSRSQEARVSMNISESHTFDLSGDGSTWLMADCNIAQTFITFTVSGVVRVIITDVELHDTFKKVGHDGAGKTDPDVSNNSSSRLVPVLIGILIFIAVLAVIVLIISTLRKKRQHVEQMRPSAPSPAKGGQRAPGIAPQGRRTITDTDGAYHYPSLPRSLPPGYNTAVYQEIEKQPDLQISSEAKSEGGVLGESEQYAYDLLEPTDNRNGSEKVARQSGESNGFQAPTHKKDGPSAAPTATSDDTGSNEKGPQQARGPNDYLEVLPDPEPNPAGAGPEEEPGLAHQELYQHLLRPENPYRTPSQVSPSETGEDSAAAVTEEEYSMLDITPKNDDNINQPDYFTLDSEV